MSKIKCKICEKEFERISYSHLKTHGITHKEYCEQFPDAPLISEELRKQISETRIGRTKENDEGVRRAAEKYKEICKNPTVAMIEGHKRAAEKMTEKIPTQAMIEGRKRQSEKMTGRTKENDKGMKAMSEKISGRTKENDEGVRKMAETLTGRTKKNCEYVRKRTEKLTGRTKEEYEYLRIGGEKRKGRTKENDESVRRIAEKKRGRTKENDESVRRQSEKMKGRTKEEYEYLKNHSEQMKNRTGELASNWQGGLSFEPYCIKFDNDFKERVREFFGRCCYICGKNEEDNGCKLSVHHVSYNKDTCCDDSKPLFVPLCQSCHMKTLKNRKYWEEFFSISLKCLTNEKCFYTKEEIGGET